MQMAACIQSLHWTRLDYLRANNILMLILRVKGREGGSSRLRKIIMGMKLMTSLRIRKRMRCLRNKAG